MSLQSMAAELEGESSRSKSPQNNANGSINGTAIISRDEEDLPANRRPIPRDEEDLQANRRSNPDGTAAPVKRVHWVWDIFALGSIVTFTADVGSDIFVAIMYFRNGEYSWFGFTIGFVLLSSFTLQIFSAKWLHEDQKKETWLTYLLHLFHVGPILRYWRAYRSGWKTRKKNADPNEYKYFLEEWRDICMLRLFEAYLESAPQLVLQLYILAYHRRVKTESDIRTAATAAISLVSLAWSIVAYTGALREVTFNKISWTGLFFQILWRLFMLASRITAFVLFASFFRLWIFVAIGIHWLMMFLFLVNQYSTFCSDSDGNIYPIREVFYNGIIAFVYNFSFFNISEGSTRTKVLVFYTITFIEGTVFVVLWFPHRALFGSVSYAAISLFFGGFVLGIFFMIIYYQFYHPSISQKGFCFKKGQQLHFTKVRCCCCDLGVIRHAETWQNESQNVERLAVSSAGNRDLSPTTQSPTRTTSPKLLDLDIVPRYSSREQIPHLVSPSEAFYLQNLGRVEVSLPSASSPVRSETRPISPMWI